jgi:hypothetical protein
MAEKKIKINRAPVMTLWAVVVAERMGYTHEEALTLGKAVAGLNAQAKGRRLGIFEEADDKHEERKGEARDEGKPETVTLLGRPVPVTHTKAGIRAVSKGKPITPNSVERYLSQKFKELDTVREAMEALAKAYPPDQLAGKAYGLYEKFRPEVPEGQKGWGAAGELNLETIRSLAPAA